MAKTSKKKHPNSHAGSALKPPVAVPAAGSAAAQATKGSYAASSSAASSSAGSAGAGTGSVGGAGGGGKFSGTSKVKLVPGLFPSGSSYTASGAPPLKQVVDSTVRNLLGLGLREKDPKAVLAALRQRFEKKTIQGRTVWEYNPRAGAQVTATSGALPAKQAKLYQRAKEAEAVVLPILDALKPLAPEYDPELVEGTRSIVRTEFTIIVSEFARPYGPREARVDQLFAVLRGDNEGVLSELQDHFGLESSNVNTRDEQQILTNYEIATEYIESLFRIWEQFKGSEESDFSSQAISLQRSLEFTAEAVKQVEAALDSVSLFADERENSPIVDKLTLADGLSWIESFTDEAQRILEASGKRGVIAISGTFVPLVDFVDAVIEKGNQDAANAKGGTEDNRFKDVDVQQSLATLRSYLEQARDHAEAIKKSERIA